MNSPFRALTVSGTPWNPVSGTPLVVPRGTFLTGFTGTMEMATATAPATLVEKQARTGSAPDRFPIKSLSFQDGKIIGVKS